MQDPGNMHIHNLDLIDNGFHLPPSINYRLPISYLIVFVFCILLIFICIPIPLNSKLSLWTVTEMSQTQFPQIYIWRRESQRAFTRLGPKEKPQKHQTPKLM